MIENECCDSLIDWLVGCMLQGKSMVCRYLVEHNKAYLTGGDSRARDSLDGFNILDYDVSSSFTTPEIKLTFAMRPWRHSKTAWASPAKIAQE